MHTLACIVAYSVVITTPYKPYKPTTLTLTLTLPQYLSTATDADWDTLLTLYCYICGVHACMCIVYICVYMYILMYMFVYVYVYVCIYTVHNLVLFQLFSSLFSVLFLLLYYIFLIWFYLFYIIALLRRAWGTNMLWLLCYVVHLTIK